MTRQGLRWVLLVVLIAAGSWAYQHFDLESHLTLEGMRARVEAHAPYGPLLFIGVCIAGIFLHFPEIVLIALGGMLFDWAHAFAYGWIASIVGTTSTFLLVRYFFRDTFRRSLTARFAGLRALDDRLARHGFVTVLALRLVLFTAPPLNWAIAATSVRASHYVAATAVGVIPGIAATVFFAEAITSRGQGRALVNAKTVVGAVLVAGFLVAATIASRRLLGKPGGRPRA